MRIDATSSLNTQLLAQRARQKSESTETTKPQKTAPSRPVDLPQAVPPSTPTGPTSPAAPLTRVDALLEAWGQESSLYDLNADGTVDGADLGQLLAGNVPTLSALPPATETETPQSSARVDGLLAAWGQNDSIYDLNADGTVDGADLGQLLAGSVPTLPADPPAQDPAARPSARVNSLLENWGQTDSPFDLTGDGTVDGADLGQLLLGQVNGSGGAPAAALDQPAAGPSIADFAARITKALFAGSDAGANRLRSAHRVIAQGLTSSLRENPGLNLDALASRLLDSLLTAGGNDKPELALRKTIDQLDLSPQRHQAVLHRLASIYPNGLGVNKLG